MKKNLGIIGAILAAILASSAVTAAAEGLITGAKIKNGTISGLDIRNGSIKRSDLSPNTRGLDGEDGVDGLNGSVGAAGPQGPAGIANIQYVRGAYVQQCADGGGACQVAGATATCPSGTVVIGGGFDASKAQDIIAFSEPVANDWRIIATNFSTTSAQVAAYAVCASGPGVGTARRSVGDAYQARLEGLRAEMDAP